MKDAEKAIESVMAGLRRAEATPGIEGRLHDHLRRRMAEAGTGGRSHTSVFGWRWLALGCGVVAAVLAMAIDKPQVDRRLGAGRIIEKADPGGFEAGKKSVNHAAGTDGGVYHRLKVGSRDPREGAAEALSRREAISPSFSRRSGRAPNELVSFPAPPMSLTTQEKLLLRVVNHSGPEEMAMLDLSGRAAQDAEETTIFQDFFGKPVSLEQTMQKDNQGESR